MDVLLYVWQRSMLYGSLLNSNPLLSFYLRPQYLSYYTNHELVLLLVLASFFWFLN